MTEGAATAERIEVQAQPDVFVDQPGLNTFFTNLADFLAHWHWEQGLRYTEIRVSRRTWSAWNMMAFKMTHASDSTPICIGRYRPQVVAPGKSAARQMDFIRNNAWFQRFLQEVEVEIKEWMRLYRVPNDQLDITNRWTSNGVIIIKLIDKRRDITPDTHMVHKRYE